MSWHFMDPASRKNIDELWRREAEHTFALATDPSVWENPTAAGHWQVRDVISHMVDTTETYLHCFEAARGASQLGEPLGIRSMAENMDANVQTLRAVGQQELLRRLRRNLSQFFDIVNELTDEEWTELLVPHKYMGSVPACFLPICQVLDCIVHNWDIREGGGYDHGLAGDSADLLVPVCFLMWQNTSDTTGVDPFSIGIRVTTGVNAGETKATVNAEGIDFSSATVAGLPAIVEFDPASLVLTAFGRANAGTYRGDQELINRFMSLFFRI